MSFIVNAGRCPQGERAMTTYDQIVLRTVRFAIRFIVSISLPFFLTANASASSPHCLKASSITPDEIYRGDGRQAGQPDCFQIQTPAAGFLMLDLAVPGPATAEPRLALLGPSCERSADVDVIERSASHLLVVSDAPQALTVCAGAQDPLQALGEFKLRTAFAELDPNGSRKAEEIEAEPDPFTDDIYKAEEIEAEPDPFAGCPQKAEEIEAEPDPFTSGTYKAEEIEAEPDPFAGCTRKAEEIEAEPDPFTDVIHKAEEIEAEPDPFTDVILKAEEIEAEPDPFTDDVIRKAEEIEAEPDPFAGSDPWDALCQIADFDDHSDIALCATATELGRSLQGEIGNGWGDDHDVFAFELTAPRTVVIETAGDTDTFGGLYNHLGQRLAKADDGGSDDNFRLAKTLQPGLYFVRVEAALGAQGAYRLTIDEIERW